MCKYQKISLIVLACLPLTGMSVIARCSGAAEKQPNIVFLLADDLGWTGLRCFGSDFYETPNLDRLAQEGMKFTDAYAACTVCSPTRASIMTGMYPARLHLTDFIAGQNRPKAKLQIPDWTKRLESTYVTIAEALQSSGYRTCHVGKWHLEARGSDPQGTDPRSQGFDLTIQKPKGTRGYFLPKRYQEQRSGGSESETGYLTDWLTDQACSFIEEQQESANPFFLYFAYHTPHTPIQGRPDLVRLFESKVDPSAVHRNPEYAAMVSSLDQSVGRILETLQNAGFSENTIIVFTSDNGGLTQRYGVHDGFTENLPLRRGKGSAYEGGVRVPAIVKWPGKVPAGSVCSTPIMTIDYYPTFLELAGVNGDSEHNANVDGKSLAPLLHNPNANLTRDLFWHYPHYHAGGDGPYSAIRSGDLRLIEFLEDNSLHLYDLSQDIGEQHNLAEELPEQTMQLKMRLDHWRASIDAQMPTANPNYDPSASARPNGGK